MPDGWTPRAHDFGRSATTLLRTQQREGCSTMMALTNSLRASAIRIGGAVAPQCWQGRVLPLLHAGSLVERSRRTKTGGKAHSAFVNRRSPTGGHSRSNRTGLSLADPAEAIMRPGVAPPRMDGSGARHVDVREPLLDSGFDCVAFDLPAHGQSTGHHLNLPMGLMRS